jgi:hypothetical protein
MWLGGGIDLHAGCMYIPRALFCCASPQEIVIKALGNCASCYIVIDRDDSIHTHTRTCGESIDIRIYKNNKQKLRLIYPTWNSIIRPRLFFRARGWELAVVIDPPRGNWVPELPSGGGRCHSPRCTSTHARYISARYMPSIKWLAKDARSKEEEESYIHARMLHVLHHRSHGCTSPYYLISNAASFDLVCYLYIQPLGQITLKSFSLLLLY